MYIQSLSIGWFRLIDSAAYVIGDPGVNKISDELHDAAVGISMVQGGGSDGTLEDVDDNTAAQQLDRTALDKPEMMRENRSLS